MAQLAFGCVSCAARTTCLDFVHAPEGLGQLTEPLATFKYMIPTGAPVTATLMGEKRNGYVLSIDRDNEMPYPYRVSTGTNIPLRYRCDEVKIRYDNPAPFTLWQLNALVNCKAEMPWAGRASIVLLAPENIQAAWDTHKLSYYDSLFLS